MMIFCKFDDLQAIIAFLAKTVAEAISASNTNPNV